MVPFSLFHSIDIPKLKRENIKIASCHIDVKNKIDYSDGNYYFVGVFGVVHTLEAKSMFAFKIALFSSYSFHHAIRNTSNSLV